MMGYAAFDPSGSVDCIAVRCDAEGPAAVLHYNWGHYSRCSWRMSVALVVLGVPLVLGALVVLGALLVLMASLLGCAALDPSGSVDCIAVRCDAQGPAALLRCNWGHYAHCSSLMVLNMSVALVVLGALSVLGASTSAAGDCSSSEVAIYTPGGSLVYVSHWLSM
jgi:hypothetical protein